MELVRARQFALRHAGAVSPQCNNPQSWPAPATGSCSAFRGGGVFRSRTIVRSEWLSDWWCWWWCCCCCVRFVCAGVEHAVDNNNNTRRMAGEIPTMVGQLDRLVFLDLGFNELTGGLVDQCY